MGRHVLGGDNFDIVDGGSGLEKEFCEKPYLSAWVTAYNDKYVVQIRLNQDIAYTMGLGSIIVNRIGLKFCPKRIQPNEMKHKLQRALEIEEENRKKPHDPYFEWEDPTYPDVFVKEVFSEKPTKVHLRHFMDRCLLTYSEDDVDRIENKLNSLTMVYLE